MLQPNNEPQSVLVSVQIYSWLLRSFPKEFRQEYGEEALKDFRHCCCNAYMQGGTCGVLQLWPSMLARAMVDMGAEHFEVARQGKKTLFTHQRTSSPMRSAREVTGTLARFARRLVAIALSITILILVLLTEFPGFLIEFLVVDVKSILIGLGLALGIIEVSTAKSLVGLTEVRVSKILVAGFVVKELEIELVRSKGEILYREAIQEKNQHSRRGSPPSRALVL